MSEGKPPPAPVPKPAPGGYDEIDLVAAIESAHAAQIELMKGQLIIALVLRMGGSVSIPVKEIDATGPYVLTKQLTGQSFLFVVERKQ